MTANATIYSLSDRTVDSELLAKLAPDAEITSDAWSLIASWPDVAIRLTPMADDYRPGHLQGLMNHLVAQTGGDPNAIAPVLSTVQAVQQVFGIVVEPDFDPTHRAMSLLISLTATLESAFTYANDMFYDPFGQIWLGAEGAPPLAELGELRVIKVPAPVETSPAQEARTERVLMQTAAYGVPCYQGHIRWVGDEESVTLRSATDVARRVVAMHSVVTYARGRPRAEVLADIEGFGVAADLSPTEANLLHSEPLDEAARQEMIWSLEALVPLMWALGFIDELAWPESMIDVEALHDLIFTSLPTPEAVNQATLRSATEVLDAVELTVRQHNGLRGCHTSGDLVPMNFNWNDPTEMVVASRSLAAPVLAQRHRAMNWLIRFGDADWDYVDTPT